jgi:hypothetical protein
MQEKLAQLGHSHVDYEWMHSVVSSTIRSARKMYAKLFVCE